jgi:hypothetical protein
VRDRDVGDLQRKKRGQRQPRERREEPTGVFLPLASHCRHLGSDELGGRQTALAISRDVFGFPIPLTRLGSMLFRKGKVSF